MDYTEAMSFLEETKQYGSRLGLDNIRALMHALGDVQERIPVIHIGGTNGKGSVGAMLSSIFTKAGYRTGWFNSPDVFAYEEEFRLNGMPIEKERLAQLFTKVQAACIQLAAEGMPHPTRFEVETAAAFLWFYEEFCDLAIIEVGMGGATDATNILDAPLVSVLTSIGRDHMHTLGNSLMEIAEVKAGIIKPGCPVVSVEQEPEAMQVIVKRCETLGSSLYRADDGLTGEFDYAGGSSSFCWHGRRICLGLGGPFQMENAACALKTVEVLRERDPDRWTFLTDDAVACGLEQAGWAGRYEKVKRGGPRSPGPVIVLDGAHNEAAAMRLREALDLDFPDRNKFYIMGVLADKEYDVMAGILFRPGDRVWTIAPQSARALQPQDLADCLRRQKIDAVPCTKGSDAVSCVLGEAGAEDVIVVFGSLYCLREMREAFDQREMKN